MLAELGIFLREFDRLMLVYDENPSLEDRVKETGILSREMALDLGTVGIVARASGISIDSRLQSPFPPYDTLVPAIPVHTAGDVDARALVRSDEIRESVRLLERMLRELPPGGITAPFVTPAPDRSGLSLVEGWRGEIVYWVQSGRGREVSRCMVRDPSSLNWLGLEQAIHGNIVPDFPVCNKSFNQSYSGHDL